MPDVLRQQLADGTVLTDFTPAGFTPWFLVNDTLKYAPGQKTRVQAVQPTRKGGSLTVAEYEGNGQLSATFCCVGATQDAVWQNAGALLAALDRCAGAAAGGLQDLRLYWQPEGVAGGHAYLFVQDGSADWQHAYSWSQLSNGLMLTIEAATWQVRPVTW